MQLLMSYRGVIRVNFILRINLCKMRKYNSKRLLAKYLFKALDLLEDSDGIQFFESSASRTMVSIFYELLSRPNFSPARLYTRKEKSQKLAVCFRDPILLSEAFEFLLIHKKRSLQFCNDFFLLFQAHLGNGKEYQISRFQATDLCTESVPRLKNEDRDKYLSHAIGTPTSITERFFYDLNKKNDTDYCILSEHAFSVDNPDTNISNL